jgi:hypothetical protein
MRASNQKRATRKPKRNHRIPRRWIPEIAGLFHGRENIRTVGSTASRTRQSHDAGKCSLTPEVSKGYAHSENAENDTRRNNQCCHNARHKRMLSPSSIQEVVRISPFPHLIRKGRHQISCALSFENGFPPVATIHHVIDRSGILDSEFSCHKHDFAPKEAKCQRIMRLCGTDPFSFSRIMRD